MVKTTRRKKLIDNRLNRIFTGQTTTGEGAFRGDARLLLKIYKSRRYVKKIKKKITLDDVRDFLESKAAYSLHANARKVWPRNKVMVYAPGYQFACDLIVIDKRVIVKQNRGYRYILSVLDNFSRRAVTQPLKQKSGVATADALRIIIPKLRKLQPPYGMSSDLGKEFYNQDVKKVFRDNDFHMFESSGETHTPIVERFNRTLQNILYRHFDTNNTFNWVDHIEHLTKGYNNTVHRSLGVSPNNVDLNNYNQIFRRLNSKYLQSGRKKPKLKVDDMVRLNILHSVFGKSYEETFSYQVYFVDSVTYPDGGIYPMYKIRDLRGKMLPSRYYYHELKKIPKDTFLNNYEFPIEKVLDRRDDQLLVKFHGYDNSYNQWLPAKSIRYL